MLILWFIFFLADIYKKIPPIRKEEFNNTIIRPYSYNYQTLLIDLKTQIVKPMAIPLMPHALKQAKKSKKSIGSPLSNFENMTASLM